MITDEELAGLPAKTKKNPDVVEMYRRHDYIDAYAMHTDMRVAQDGYRGAVGAVGDWDRHGDLQLRFLRRVGLKPDDALLDVGCGTGRLARKAIPYLMPDRYYGVDISRLAVAAAVSMLESEGFCGRYHLSTEWPDVQVDVAWAFSVTIHLPSDEMLLMMRRVAERMRAAGRFYFSYVPERVTRRTGLKQFRHRLDDYVSCAALAGFAVRDCPDWDGEQRVMEATLR